MSAAMSFTGGSFGGKNISNNLRGSTLRLGQSMYNPGGNRVSQVRASTVGRASEVYNRILENAQGGEEHLDQIFQRLNTIQVHLDNAVKNLEAEEILKFKAECEFFDNYCIKNLELLLKLAKDRNPVFFQTGYKIWIAINNIIDWKNQTFNKKENLKDQVLNGIATFFGRFSQQFTNAAQTGTLTIAWNKKQQTWSAVDLAEYQTVVTKNLFYWAKIGAVENFSKAVNQFNISNFNRIRIVYKNVKKKDAQDAIVERKTVAMYHKNLMDNNNVSDDDSDESFDQTYQKQKKKKKNQDEQNQQNQKNLDYKNDRFRHEYKLPDLCPDFTLYQTSISSDGLVVQSSAQDRIYNAESVIAEVTPLLVAIQYKQFNLVHFIIEKMNIDVRMSLTLTSHTRYNIQAKKTGQEIKQKVKGFFQSKFTKEKQSQDSETDTEQDELEKIEKEREEKEKAKRKQPLQEPIWIQNLTDEQVSFGLLTAIANEDSLIFRYLWDQLGSYYWGIGQLRCVLKQMIFQSWTYGLNVLFQSETTHQMVKALNSYERTQFVEEYIGLPFSNQFEFEVRQCLVYNLCQEPFACSMIIHIIERFQELQSLSSKSVQRMTHVNVSKTYQSVPLGNNLEDVEQQFSKIWNMCLKSLYPMEIQILKESCQDKFEQFAQTLDHLASENKNLSKYYIQAIKIIQLLKGCSTFKGIFEEARFPSTDEEDNNENEQLVKQESKAFREVNEVQEGRFYQKIQDYSQKFRQTVKKIGIRRIEELIFQVLRGDIQQLEYLISIKYQLRPQDLIEIRGIDFNLPYLLKLNGEKELTVGLTTANWGLIDFAIYFNQLNVLHYLHKKLQNFIDFSTVISGQTWITTDQKHVLQVPEIMASEGIPLKNFIHYDFQLVYKGVSMVTKKESLSFIFIDCADLRGYVLAILAKNQIGLRFLMNSCSKHGQHLSLTDLFRLLIICFMIDWNQGVFEILQSTLTKNTFVLSNLIDKIDFVRICFAQIYSKKQDEVLISGAEPSAQPYEIIQEDSDFRNHNSQMKTLQTILFSFPFISVTWIILNELGWPTHLIDSQIFNKTGKNVNLINVGFGVDEESERKSNMNVFGKQLMVPYLTYEKLITQRELNIFKMLIEKNFQGMTISMLESINQTQAILQLTDEKEDDLIKINEQLMKEIIDKIQNLEKVHIDQRDYQQIEYQKQKLHELKQSQEIRDEIFKLQHLVVKRMKSDGLRSIGELAELTQSIVNDIIIPEINQQNQRNFQKSLIETLNEILQAETIVYIASLKGYNPNQSEDNFEIQNKSERLVQILDDLKYLPVKDMNILHWSIVSRQDDIMNYLLESYFKHDDKDKTISQIKPTATNIHNLMQDIKNGETSLDIEPSILSSCLSGHSEGPFQIIEILDKKDSPHKLLDQQTKQFTVQLSDDLSSSLSPEISQARKDIRQLQISNLGLVLIIMTKNLKALKQIQKLYPTIFQTKPKTPHGDILDGILLCGLKQWSTGAQLLLPQAEIQFVKLPLLQRLRYCLKIFQIMKSFRNQNTLQVMQSILSLQKIRNFIEWLSKPAQDEVRQMEIQTSLIQDGHCLQLFPEQSQIIILNQMRNQSASSQLLIEFKNVVEIEEQICWRQGVYSNIFQAVVQKKNEDAKKKGIINNQSDQRDIELLNYLIEQGVIIAKQKGVSQSNH